MAKKNILVDLDFNQNEVQNAVVQNLASAPATPKAGQHYFNTSDNKEYVYDGSNWVEITNQGEILTFSSPLVKTGTNVTINSASNTGSGAIRIATDAEATTGTSEVLAVNPKQLATKITANAAITAGTYTKVTVDTKGLVTSGGSLVASDIPDVSATYVPQTAVGQANGVASLGADGKVPSAQLPSYVDDVIELNTLAASAPATCATGDKYYNTTTKLIYTATATDTWGTTGETPDSGVIYVAKDTNASYRWSGSDMINIANPISAATESTPGIAAIATQAEVTAGSNDTKFVTPLKLATAMSGSAFKETATNPALTQSGGVCTWTVSTSKAPGCIVAVYETSGGAEVLCDVTHGSGSLTIKINSASNISAGFYTAVVIG